MSLIGRSLFTGKRIELSGFPNPKVNSNNFSGLDCSLESANVAPSPGSPPKKKKLYKRRIISKINNTDNSETNRKTWCIQNAKNKKSSCFITSS